jgi:hypothetical protein
VTFRPKRGRKVSLPDYLASLKQPSLDAVTNGKGRGPFTERERLIRMLDEMTRRARAFLSVHKIEEGDKQFKILAESLDIPSYEAAISGALRSFNRPDAGITPKASASGDAARYKGRLDLYGAVAILLRVPVMRARLVEIGEANLHIGEACQIAEEFAFLRFASLTLNVSSVEQEATKKFTRGLAVHGHKGPEKRKLNAALQRENLRIPEIDAATIDLCKDEKNCRIGVHRLYVKVSNRLASEKISPGMADAQFEDRVKKVSRPFRLAAKKATPK